MATVLEPTATTARQGSGSMAFEGQTKSARAMSLPGMLLRLEGLAALSLGIWLYARQDASWLPFAVLLLAPDLSMVGYLAGNRIGAFTYNLAHTYVSPGILGAIGLAADSTLLIALALIWTAHIGMDRAIGYGLKYAEGFKLTHLSKV